MSGLRDHAVVVVPAHNEEAVIGGVIEGLLPMFCEIVCVDDGSTDATSQRAREAGARVLRHCMNRGQGAALQTGLEWARRRPGMECVVTFDGDGQHRPDDAAAMVDALRDTGVDVVLGSRFLTAAQTVPKGRTLLLKAATTFTRLTSGAPVTDAHNGLRVLSRGAVEKVSLSQDGMAHASEILHLIQKRQLSWSEFPVTIDYTEHSKAKGQSVWNSVNILWDLTWKG